jgi:hypothetical protein
MTIAQFKIELARLLKKGSTSGLSSDDIAYELTEAAEDVTIVEENDQLDRFHRDPVGDVIGPNLMAEDATPLVEALVTIIDAARAYLPPDGIGKDAFITQVLEAVDNPKINAALAAHGHPVAG